MATTLTYQMPNIGTVKIDLHGIAEEIYNILEKEGVIHDLKSRSQLGVIRSVCEGAHHTKWEYVILQLFLLWQIRKNVKSSGLSNNRPKINNRDISGLEIVQSWILLLNSGHLDGTFANEKAFLLFLKYNDRLCNEFIRGISDVKMQSYSKGIIERGDVYKFHHALALFVAARLKRRNSNLGKSCEEVLKLYISQPATGRSRRRNLLDIFKKVRLISMVYLDASYGPIPITFDLSQFIFDFEYHTGPVFNSSGSLLLRTIKAISSLLTDSFYMSDKVLYVHMLQVNYSLAALKSSSISCSTKSLYTLLRSGFPKLQQWNPDDKDLLRLLINRRRLVGKRIRSMDTISIENEWNSVLPSSYCKCLVERDIGNELVAIVLSFNKNLKVLSYSRIFSKIVGLLYSFKEQFKDKQTTFWELIVSQHFGQPVQCVFLFMLGKLLASGLDFTPIYTENAKDLWLVERGSRKVAVLLQEFLITHLPPDADADRVHELNALKESVRAIGHRGLIVCTTAQIRVRDCNDMTDVAELDGVVFIVSATSLSLLIVEAKNRRNPVSLASSQLNTSLSNICLPGTQISPITPLPRYGAYAVIRFS